MFVLKFWSFFFDILGLPRKYKYDNKTEDESLHYFLSRSFTLISVALVTVYFISGSLNANDPNECRVHKISDAVITFPYAIGCNLFKNRFDVKLN